MISFADCEPNNMTQDDYKKEKVQLHTMYLQLHNKRQVIQLASSESCDCLSSRHFVIDVNLS